METRLYSLTLAEPFFWERSVIWVWLAVFTCNICNITYLMCDTGRSKIPSGINYTRTNFGGTYYVLSPRSRGLIPRWAFSKHLPIPLAVFFWFPTRIQFRFSASNLWASDFHEMGIWMDCRATYLSGEELKLHLFHKSSFFPTLDNNSQGIGGWRSRCLLQHCYKKNCIVLQCGGTTRLWRPPHHLKHSIPTRKVAEIYSVLHVYNFVGVD